MCETMKTYCRKNNFDIDLLCDLRKEIESFFCRYKRTPFLAYQIIFVEHTEVCAQNYFFKEI